MELLNQKAIEHLLKKILQKGLEEAKARYTGDEWQQVRKRFWVSLDDNKEQTLTFGFVTGSKKHTQIQGHSIAELNAKISKANKPINYDPICEVCGKDEYYCQVWNEQGIPNCIATKENQNKPTNNEQHTD